MRLNFLLVVLIIAALGASGFFVINYFNQSTSAQDLEKQIETTNTKIQELTASNESLAAEIENLKAAQSEVQTALESQSPVVIDKPDSTEVIRSVMELGLNNGTTIIPLSTSDWAKVKILQGDYQVFRMNFKIEGTERNVIDFVRALQDLYPVLVIESFSISAAGTGETSGGTSTPAEVQFSSNLIISVYAR